jgi:hypothetical protein
MWIVTDKTTNNKWLSKNKPVRQERRGIWDFPDGEFQILDKFPFEELPAFIKDQQWKDAPIQIKFEIKKK